MSEEPPYDRNGRVNPVIGSAPTTPPAARSCSLTSQSHLHPPAPLHQPAVQCPVSEVARPVPVAIAPPRVVIQTQSPTLTERPLTGFSSSISCLPLELTGLKGPISTRTALCCTRSNSPTLEDLHSIPLVVRLNGRFSRCLSSRHWPVILVTSLLRF